MSTITLYHGTTKENFESIIADGVLCGPVYLTPNKSTAEDYAANNSPDYMVFEVKVCFDDLNYDDEFVSEGCVYASLEAGSVYVDGNVSIKDAKVTKYEDYEEIED